MEDKEEYLEFDLLIRHFKIKDSNRLMIYLRAVYEDLSGRREFNKDKGISKITFIEYFNIPIFIAEKLFSCFDKDNSNYLSFKEFSDGMSKLYSGDFEQTLKLVFSIYDFDKDGLINPADVKLIFSYLPLKCPGGEISYKYQMESLSEIEDLLYKTFGERAEMDENEFIKCIENKKSDIYLQLICFLYANRPFCNENLNMYGKPKLNSFSNYNRHLNLEPIEEGKRRKILSPTKKSRISCAENFIKPILDSLDSSNLILVSTSSVSSEKKDGNNIIRLSNNSEINLEKMNLNDLDNSKELNNLLPNAKNKLETPTYFCEPKKKDSNLSRFSLDDGYKKIEYTSGDEIQIEEKLNHYEGNVLKLEEDNSLKTYWLVLQNKDLYFYNNDNRDNLEIHINLTSCFVRENKERVIENINYYVFSLIIGEKTIYILSKQNEVVKEWIKYLKSTVGYQSFFDTYKMLDQIGQGKFGTIKLGINKKTHEKVAIKIVKKENLSATDLELVKSEMEIMKHCKHPNVVKLIDNYENTDYIFFVMEYLTGGNLEDYFVSINYKISEEIFSRFIYQIASGFEYLHQFGILHRDLKPENLMLTDSTPNCQIKIMDFGLSKILGPREKVADGFGTLSFAAPEVLVRIPYDKRIDIWSLGVLIFLGLSGTLPFDDENDNEEVIANKIVFNEVEFPPKVWNSRSRSSKDLINKCLVKNPDDRITMKEFLNHEWILNFNN
jgi:Ca2+-binding EF-hand superfamily protein